MIVRKCLILQCVAATTLVAISAACSAGSSDDDGGGASFGAFAGAYTLSYSRVQANSNCTSEDPDWIQGILIVDDGEFDFGGTYQVPAQLTGPDTYSFEGDLSDGTGLVHVSGVGTFVEGTGGSVQIAGGDDDGIVADYVTECRVRGTYTGNKTTSSFGP